MHGGDGLCLLFCYKSELGYWLQINWKIKAEVSDDDKKTWFCNMKEFILKISKSFNWVNRGAVINRKARFCNKYILFQFVT